MFMTTEQGRLLYRVPEAAEALGISRVKCYELAARGAIPTVRIGGGSIRIPVRALESWIASQVSDGAEAGGR
jgi:excisionase family DNA binding protein